MNLNKQKKSDNINNEDLIKILEEASLVDIRLKKNEQRLKMVLLNSSYFQKNTIMSIIISAFTIKKLAFVGIFTVVALAVIFGTSFFNKNKITPRVNAKEVVNKTMEALKSKKSVGLINLESGFLSWKELDQNGNITDDKGNIIFVTASSGSADDDLVTLPGDKAPAYMLIKDSFESSYMSSYVNSFQEAQKSKDLTYLGKKVLSTGEKITMLRFTDNNNKINILGVNEGNLPVVKFTYGKDGEALILESGGGTLEEGEKSQLSPKDSGSDITGGGNGGVLGEGEQDTLAGYNSIDDIPSMSASAQNPEFLVKFWTENLE